jgi:Ser/Thr protein kinase RdoA (MazF antagonist)
VLAQEDVLQFLLTHALVGPEAVVEGDLAISDVSSRNRNFRVETRRGPCYLLKQGTTPEATATVAHEATVYRRLVAADPGLATHLPRFCGYEPGSGVLVLELVREAEDLRSRHLRAGAFSTGPASALGFALGTLHRTTRGVVSEEVPTGTPWVLWAHRPDSRLFRDVSAAGLELIRIVQASEGFPEALERQRTTWRTDTLIHGDMKWDNCLVSSHEDSRDDVKLIDWEVAIKGDPCWDIGSALSQYLSAWLFSIPVTGEVPPERFPELAGYPLDAMKPALVACWQAYADARQLDRRSTAGELRRAVELAGARLVQTAFEAAQMMQQLTSSLILHLQLALNVLLRPRAAATQLLGLPELEAGAHD